MNLYYVLSVFGSRMMNLLTVLMLSYLLNATEFGQFTIVSTNALLLHLFASSWITNSLWREASKANENDTASIVAQSLRYCTPVIAISLAAVPLSLIWLRPTAHYLSFIFLLAPLILLIELASVALNAGRKHRDYSLLSLFRGTFSLVAAGFLVLSGLELFGALSGQIIGIMLSLVALKTVRAMPKGIFAVRVNWRHVGPQLRFGLISALALNLYMLGNALCRNFVAFNLGEAEAGYLSLASDMFYAPVALFATSLSLSSIPDLYEAHGDDRTQTRETGAHRSAAFILANFAVALPYAVGGALTAPALATLALDETTAKFVAPIAGYAAIQGACYALFSTLTTLALTQGRIRLALSLSLGVLFAIAAAMLIAAPQNSLIAIAQVTTIVILLFTIGTLVFAGVAFDVRLPVGEIGRLLLATLLLFAAVWVSMTLFPPHLSLFAAIALGGGGFILSAFILQIEVVVGLFRLKSS